MSRSPLSEPDLDVRRVVYARVVADGRPPTVHEVARELGREEGGVGESYRRLHEAHALVLFDPDWEPRSVQQSQAILGELGLVGPFLVSAGRDSRSRESRPRQDP